MKKTKRIAAVGDIHGHPRAAKAAIELIENIGARGIFLGDYVDRGPSSVNAVKELIKAQRKNPDWVFLLGNHEQMLLDLLEEPPEENPSPSEDAGDEYTNLFSKRFVEWKKHLRFLRSLPLYHETKEYLFVHGGIAESWNRPLSQIPKDELIWTYGVNSRFQGKIVVRGHQVVDQVTVNTNNIQIDTGLCFDGHLSVVVLEDGKRAKSGIVESYRIDKEGNVEKTGGALRSSMSTLTLQLE